MTYTGQDRIDSFFAHHGIKGQKWGLRRFQNPDGSLTSEGLKRYSKDYNKNGELTRKARKADDRYRKAISDAYSSKRIKLIDKYMAKAEKDPDNEKRWRKYLSKSNDVAIEIRKEFDEATDKYTKKHGNMRVDSAIDEVMKERQRTNPEHAEKFEEVAESLKASYKDKADKADAEEIRKTLINEKTSEKERQEIYKYASETTDDKNVKKYLSPEYVPSKLKGIIDGIKKAKSEDEIERQMKKFNKILEDDELRYAVKSDPIYRNVVEAPHNKMVDAVVDYKRKTDEFNYMNMINEMANVKLNDIKKR